MLRVPVLLRVQVDGKEERRPAVPVHLYDRTGMIVATGLRPSTFPGEVLVDRIGTYPKIIRETA